MVWAGRSSEKSLPNINFPIQTNKSKSHQNHGTPPAQGRSLVQQDSYKCTGPQYLIYINLDEELLQ
jgi:hypothetical protein